MEKNADLMIFRHENDLRLQEFAYLCKREVKWTLSQTFERLELHLSAFWTDSEYLQNLTCTVQILKVLSVKII